MIMIHLQNTLLHIKYIANQKNHNIKITEVNPMITRDLEDRPGILNYMEVENNKIWIITKFANAQNITE